MLARLATLQDRELIVTKQPSHKKEINMFPIISIYPITNFNIFKLRLLQRLNCKRRQKQIEEQKMILFLNSTASLDQNFRFLPTIFENPNVVFFPFFFYSTITYMNIAHLYYFSSRWVITDFTLLLFWPTPKCLMHFLYVLLYCCSVCLRRKFVYFLLSYGSL